MRSPRSRTSSLRYWASIRTASVDPVIKADVVGEKVPLGIPGNSTAGIFGQRPAYTVARIGGAFVDGPVERVADEVVAGTRYLQVAVGQSARRASWACGAAETSPYERTSSWG